MKALSIRGTVQAGIIAALYVVISLAFYPLSFSVYQIRFAEALTVLPFLTASAIPGLYIGCLLANIFGGNGWLDIVIGSLLTLTAAVATRAIFHFSIHSSNKTVFRWLAPLPPVIFNSFGVAIYLAPIAGFNYWFAVQMIGIGQLVSCYAMGLPLLYLLEKRLWFKSDSAAH